MKSRSLAGKQVGFACLASLIVCVCCSGCVQTQWQAGVGPSQTLSTANQMMDVEETDRVSRFQRLAQVNGIAPPQITQQTVPASLVPGATRPIPVIRVVFDERVFFDTGSAVPRPQANVILNVIAENMRHDVPDVRVTLLGHTDAVGSDASNYDLSQRRALAVLQRLVQDGVNPGQLGTVAIGKAQPIAPNQTAAGRARNRRVEFLISPSEAANLRVVQSRPVNAAFLRTTADAAPSAYGPASAQFFKAVYAGPADFSEAPLEKRKIALSAVRQIPLDGEAEETGSPVLHAAAPTSQPTAPVEANETGSPVARAP